MALASTLQKLFVACAGEVEVQEREKLRDSMKGLSGGRGSPGL